MIYDLNDLLDRKRFENRCRVLAGGGTVVELTAKRSKRSLRTLSYLHVLIGWVAIETGHNTGYVKSNYFKKLCNPDIFVRTVTDQFTGETEVLRSIRACSAEELSVAIDRFTRWMRTQCRLYIPSPDEEEVLERISVEIKKHDAHDADI